MIDVELKQRAHEALRAAGFAPPLVRELLAGPKTMRDEHARAAMAALVAHADLSNAAVTPAAIADLSYELADALMKRGCWA